MKRITSRSLIGHIRRRILWYLLVFTIVWFVISLFALRHNNEQMAVYRSAVYAADKRGDNEALNQALHTLRNYVYGHMNTSLTSGSNAVYPPIQLQYTYERAQAAQQDQLGQINANLYHDAQEQCESDNPGGTGADTIACIERYAAAHGIQLGNVPEALYKFDFVSAKWSPDLAGISIALAGIGLVTFGYAAIRHWWKKNIR